jgi:hypothetical protein
MCNNSGILENFTMLDLIFIIILVISLYFPFYMNKKEMFSVYLFSGIILGIYTLYVTNKLMSVLNDNTGYVLFVRIILFALSVMLIVTGIFYSSKLLFGKTDNKKK